MLYSWKKWQILETANLKFRGRNMNFILFATPEEQAEGLMYRKEPLGPNQAGFFMYDRPEMRSFWMKNTYIPLKIIFLDEDYGIVDQHDCEPNQKDSITSRKPYKYVIEIQQ